MIVAHCTDDSKTMVYNVSRSARGRAHVHRENDDTLYLATGEIPLLPTIAGLTHYDPISLV